MEALLGGLNPDQLRAVTHGTGPLLVVAGAGTGKTQVITRRIAWLIATRRARPSEILALTFTDKAAEEMAVRVDQLVPYGYTDTAISTFHAFGDGLIREYALELGLPTDLRVLSRPEVVIFLREHLFEFELDAYRPLGDPTRFLAALATLFSRCKDEDIAPADYLAHADRVEREARALAAVAADASEHGRALAKAADGALEEAGRQAELARAYATYQRLLAANGCIDFGDQVALALRLVRTSAVGPRRDRRPVPLHPGRRVPGHQPGAGRAGRRARRGPPQRDRGGRRRPGDLRVPRRRRRQHPRLHGPLRRGTDDRPAAQLPVARADPRRGLPPHPVQRPGSARGPDRRRQAAPGAANGTVAGAGPARGVRHGRRGGRLDRGRDRPADRGRRRAARPRRPRPRQRPRGPDPAGTQRGRDPVALLGDVRAVRPAGGQAPARVPARRRRPRVERRPVRARGVGRLRARRRGPDRDRQHGAPPQPLGVGDPRGARATAGHPARLARRPGRSCTGSSTDLRGYATAAHERPGRGAAVPLPARQRAARPARRDATRRPPRRRSRTSPASSRSSARSRRLLADDRAVFVAPPPRDAHRGRRRSGDGRARSRRRRGRGPDRPQGQGPRVPGRLPARHGRRPLPVAAGAATRWPCPPRSVAGGRRDRRRRSPRSAGCATWR